MARGDFITPDQVKTSNVEVDLSLAAFGMYVEQPVVRDDTPEFHLWPEHLAAFNLFQELQTQWRIGMEGPTGLDYGAVIPHLRSRVPRKEFDLRYAQVRDLEYGCLLGYAELMREKRSSQ